MKVDVLEDIPPTESMGDPGTNGEVGPHVTLVRMSQSLVI